MPEELVNEASTVVLVGEAAHPFVASILFLFIRNLLIFIILIPNMFSAKTFMAQHWRSKTRRHWVLSYRK